MIRTQISLTDEDKSWIERRAKEEGVSIAEIVRRAIRHFRSQPPTRELLARTAGIRTGEDGIARQRRLRGEWPNRS